MNIRVLGCNGSQLPSFNTTSFLVDQSLLIDAGAITGVLSLEEQMKIEYIFVTHAHLDHIRDIMFLADNICYQHRREPLIVIGTKSVIEAIHRHIFNNVIWPDFSRIPNAKNPIIRFRVIKPGRKQMIGSLRITAINLHHVVETVGYIIEAPEQAVIFLGDTGPTENAWRVAGKTKNLKAVFVETSLPDSMKAVADMTGHLTPLSLAAELKKMTAVNPKIYLYHMKPNYRDVIREEVAAIKGRKIRIIEDGQRIRI